MADFEAQVNGLTGLGATLSSSTTPTDTELDQFLKDGVLDVTRRTIEVRPQDTYKFQDVTAEQTSQGANLNGAKVISVVRESGTNDDWRECRLITPSMQSRVTDTDSLDFASKLNPAYTILEDGKINVFPAPSVGGSNSYKVYYVNNSPQDSSGTALTHDDDSLKAFPDEKVYLVVIYAAIKCLEAKMAEYTIDEEDSELVQTLGTNLANLKQQYESAFAGMKPPAGGR